MRAFVFSWGRTEMAEGVLVWRRRSQRALCVLLGLAALFGAMWVWQEYIYMFGFPDGYKSELGTAENAMATWFLWFSGAIAAALFVLFCRSFFASVGRLLLIVCGLYIVVAAGCVALDLHDRTYMDDGIGG